MLNLNHKRGEKTSGDKAVLIFLVSLLLLSITAFVPISNGAFVKTYETPTAFDSTDLTTGVNATNRNIPNGTYAYVAYEQTIYNFSSYKAGFNLNATGITRANWVPLGAELGVGRLRVVIALAVLDELGSPYAVLWAHEDVFNDNLKGGSQSCVVSYGSQEQFKAGRGAPYPFGNNIGIYNIIGFQVNAFPDNTTANTVLGVYDPNAESVAGLVSTDIFSFQEGATERFSRIALYQNVTIRLAIAYTWSGTLNVAQFDEDIRTEGALTPYIGGTGDLQTGNNPDGTTDVLSGISSFVEGFMGSLTASLGSVINFFGVGLSFAFVVLTALGGVFNALIPYLPVIFIFYLLDALFASLHEGSFRPIGYFFGTMLTLAFTVFNFIVSAGQTIWDVITFWN